MISCDLLEKPGKWRGIVLVVVFLLAFAPAFPLLWVVLGESSPSALRLLGGGFGVAILHSLEIGVAVALLSILLGLPAGIFSALYDFPGRRLLLALFSISLLVPSFLWAIGLSQLRIHLGLPPDSFLSGRTGIVLAFTAPSLTLVLFITFLATRRLSKSQIESARLVDGECLLFHYVARAVFPAAAMAGMLTGVLTMSDPGPGQILGFSGVPYEILLSFSALYDFGLAAKQCIALTVAVLLISIPVAILVAPNVATGLLGRDIVPVPLSTNKAVSRFGLVALGVIFLVTTAAPMVGIIQPLFTQFPVARALQEVGRTFSNTLLYALSAGFMASILGFTLAIAIGRENTLRRFALIGLFLILSLPPSLNALGIIKVGTALPAALDPFLRSKFTVGMVLALRFLPIATLLAMRSFGSTPPSQALVAAIHGVPPSLYVRRVLVPALGPAAALSCVIVALLATAEVGTVLLLRPPGADSLPVQIFTVMANAPESLVAALCFFYVAGAAALLATGWTLTSRWRAS